MKENVNESYAIGKYLRLSPYKASRILNQIRGKRYSEARLILEFMHYKPCKAIKKILDSAAANAYNKYEQDKQNLIISYACANAGPRLKRFQPRAQGRAFPINKPTCHIKIIVQHI